MTFTRRQFIKLGSGTLAAATLGSGLTTEWWGLDSYEPLDPATDGDEIIPTYCEICFWKCGVLAHKRAGQVTKLVGNPEHPLSQGRLCPRGTGGIGLLTDPDRLKRPLLRVQARGEDVFEEVSWDTALNFAAEKLVEIRERYGPEALALLTHGTGGRWFTHLAEAFGTANVAGPSYAQCRGPREAGFGLVFGRGLGSPEPIDIENARCLTLIGSHLGENMHNTPVQEFADAIDRGMDVVVVDPRYSVAASKARYWLPIKPGTDTALLLAWIHVIVTEGRYDRGIVEEHSNGFEQLAAHVADKTPEWAYARTGLQPDLIRDSARLISAARPASLIHPGRRSTWYGNDTQRVQAMAILAALLGSWGRRGGYISPSRMDIPSYPVPAYDADLPFPADQPVGSAYPLAGETLASGLVNASIPGTAEYDIKGWLVYGTNLIQSIPRSQNTIEAIQNLDFIMSVDVLPSEICGWSDVVLPEATYLERYDDLYVPRYKQPFVALRQPVVEPMYDSKPGWWIAQQLAQRLGLEDYFPWDDAEAVVRWRADAAGIDFEQLQRTGVALGEHVPVCEEDGLAPTYSTQSGKIELFSTELEAIGFEPLPEYRSPEQPPVGFQRLISGRSPVHTFGRTTNNQVLSECFSENEVWVNSSLAATSPFDERPLENGEYVVLINQDDARSGPVKVKLTQRIRGDCVYLVHGFGHTARGLRFTYNRGASTSELTTQSQTDPLMGGTAFHNNFVRLERPEVAS